jgi:hypothetical protein
MIAEFALLGVMRTGYPQAEETTVAIATHLAFCALVCGLLVFGFYKLMQPTQRPNPGMAAYNPLPGTVINYPPATQFSYEPQAVPAAAADQPLGDTPDETTGRAVQIAEPPTAVTPMPAAQKQTSPTKPLARTASTRAQWTASTKAQPTASIKAQPPSGTFPAAYPGYAAIH